MKDEKRKLKSDTDRSLTSESRSQKLITSLSLPKTTDKDANYKVS